MRLHRDLTLVVFTLVALASAACSRKTPPPALPDSTAQAQKAAPGEPPTTKEGCDACNGKWGRHGLMDVQSCLCKTRDGGKACRDGAECQAQCLAGDDDFVVVDKGPPPKGYYQGKCAEYQTTFGCFRFIPRGASKQPPLPADDAAEQLCVD